MPAPERSKKSSAQVERESLPFLDIYIADRMANGELRDLALLGKNILVSFMRVRPALILRVIS